MHALTLYMRSGLNVEHVAPELTRYAHHTALSRGSVPLLDLEG